MTKSRSSTQFVEFVPLDYTTDHLDAIEGHITDIVDEPQPRQLPAVRQQSDRLVLNAPTSTKGQLTQRQAAAAASANGMLSATLARPPQALSMARQDDNAITIAEAGNIAARPLLIVVGVIVTAALGIAVMLFNLGAADALLGAFWAFMAWGAVSLGIVYATRRNTLHHSASGIEHHQIDARSKTEVAAIDAWRAVMLGSVGGNDDD